MRHNIADETGVRVMADKCSTCIFRPNNLMHLQPGRVAEMVREAKSKEGSIVCHKTLDQKRHAVCRGFFDHHKTQLLQVAERLGCVVWWQAP